MLIPFVLGLLFFVFGIRNIIKHIIKQKKSYHNIYGKVVKFNEKKGSSRDGDLLVTYFTPVFEYTYKGKVYQSEHNVRVSNKGKPSSHFEIGKVVELRVYEEEPHAAILNSPFGVNGLLYSGIIGIAVGAIAISIGVALINYV